MTDQAVIDELLSRMTEEELFQALGKAKSEEEEAISNSFPSTLAIHPTFSQRFYLSQKITGSDISCTQCGRDLLNDEEHALALIESQRGNGELLLDYISLQKGLTKKEVT